MRVSEIYLRGVTRHSRTTLTLPDTGVVLVTGDNGSGKSTLIEAVPLTVWGKTLRGAPLWNEGLLDPSKISAAVRVGGVLYRRTPKGRVKVKWDNGPKHDSTTKAQAELDAKFGSFDQWRRSCVLSSQDAANFTMATDADRKRMIEALTGAGGLEGAYRAALADLRTLEKDAAGVGADLRVVQERVAGIRTRLAGLVPPDGDLGPPPDYDPDAASSLRDLQTQTTRDIRERSQEIRKVEGTGRDAKAAAMDARRQRDRLSAANCPTCGQPIGDDLRASLEDAVAKAEAAAAAKEQEIQNAVADLEADLADLRREQADLSTEIDKAATAAAAAAAYDREKSHRDGLEDQRAQATADLIAAKQEQAALEVQAETTAAALVNLKAAVKTLGTKGVRAHLLGKTISAIEAAANAWLGRICHGNLRLVLRPYGTKKDGGVKDQVALSIETDHNTQAAALLEDDDAAVADAEALAGDGGRGYASASGGERRRVDVALMFALAQVAEAARGERHSTIFCDEIFDALDADGVARVSAAVGELAQDRTVVVIAHQAAQALRAVAREHWHVTQGVLARV